TLGLKGWPWGALGGVGGRAPVANSPAASSAESTVRFSPMIIVGSDRKTAIRIETLFSRYSPAVPATESADASASGGGEVKRLHTRGVTATNERAVLTAVVTF